MHQKKIKRLSVLAMLSAIAYLLMFFAFPVIPSQPYLKIDFSDIPILLGMFFYGPIGGACVALCRSFLHLLTTGFDVMNLIGDVTSFLSSLVFGLPMYYLLKKGHETRPKNVILGIICSTVSLATVMSLANAFVITPLYMRVVGLQLTMPIYKMILVGVLPFNLIKGLLVGIVFLTLYLKMVPWIVRQKKIILHH